METVIMQRTRETDVIASFIRGAIEGEQINYRKLSRLMRRDGLMGHDEHIYAIEYFPFKVADNVRVLIARSKKVNIDK